MLSFRCEYCELDFDSEPDDSGFEQAACPQCQHLSMTRGYLAKEKRPFQFSLRMFLILILIIGLVTVCSLPIWGKHGGPGGFPHGHSLWESFFPHIHLIEPLISRIDSGKGVVENHFLESNR